MKPPQTAPTLDGLIHQSSTQPATTTWFFIFMNTQEWRHVTSRMRAACGLISSPSASWCRLPRGASAAGVAPTQLLMLLNGPGRRWCSRKPPSINKWGKKTADCFLKVIFRGRASRQTPSPTGTDQVSVSDEDLLPRCVLWNLMGWCRLCCSQFKSNIPPFLFLQSFSCSYQTVFRAVKTPRSIKPCQVLLKPLQKAGAENKSNRSRPVEHGDAVGVDVTSCFTVWVCFQVEPWLNMKSPQQNQVVVLLPLASLRRSPAPFKQNNPKQMYVVESKEGHKQEWN